LALVFRCDATIVPPPPPLPSLEREIPGFGSLGRELVNAVPLPFGVHSPTPRALISSDLWHSVHGDVDDEEEE